MGRWSSSNRLKRFDVRQFMAITVVLMISLGFSIYAVQMATSANVDLLGGVGSMDDSTQVGSWTKVDVIGGTHSWSLDTSNYTNKVGAGSGKLASPSNTLDRDSYVYYRFTPVKTVDIPTLSLGYRKDFSGSSNTSDISYWSINAEIWSTGTSPVKKESILIANNNRDVTSFTSISTEVSTRFEAGVQYELRLRQTGKTKTTSTLTVWFDEVKITGEQDAVPPEVIEAQPVTDNSFDIHFNEKVGAAAENTANYSITPSLGAIQSAVIQSDGKTVRIATANKQEVNVNYTITISNVDDISGNAMSASESTIFSGIDTTGPEVIGATAKNGTTVEVTFNEIMDLASAETAGNYSFSPALSVNKAERLLGGKTVRLTTSGHTGGTNYTLTVSQGVYDMALNSVSSSANSAAFTGIDPTPPTLTGNTVVNDTVVDLIFSEPLDKGKAEIIANYNISPKLELIGAQLQSDNKTVRLLMERQTAGVSYTITVNPVDGRETNVSDTDGNYVASGSQTSFTGVDTTSPTVAGAFAVNNTAVDVIFSEPVNSTDANTASNYMIEPALSVTGAQIQSDNKTVRLTSGTMAADTSYKVTVSGVRDLGGNSLGSVKTAYFKSYVTDTTAPTLQSVKSISPTEVIVTFSERIQRDLAIDPANFSITTDAGATSLVINTVYSRDFDRQLILITEHQDAVKIYTFNINSPGNIKDLAGNALSGTTSVEFRGYQPHGFYLGSTEKCAACHVTHSAKGPKLITQQTTEILCLVCHDAAGQSKYDVGTRFDMKSNHPVNEGVLKCVDCHNPHGDMKDANTIYPHLLKTTDGTNTYYEGNMVCLACHGAVDMNHSADYYENSGGDHTNPYAAHYDQTLMDPAKFGLQDSGSKIACILCHDPHGSNNWDLLERKVAAAALGDSFKDLDNTRSGDELCLDCHGNIYNYSITVGRNVYNEYQRIGSFHDITPGVGSDTGTVEGCTNCHGPHTVAAKVYADSLGTGMSDISDPENTKKAWTQNDGDMVDWCIKCHDGSPPVGVKNVNLISPYTIVFPNKNITINASGYKKNVYKDSTHYTKVGMGCNQCHEEHGSDSYNLWLYGEDTFDVDGVCLRCHKSGGLAYNGHTADDIKTDLQKPTITATDANNYRHPVLDKLSGTEHYNYEDFQNRPLSERHAECTDCHDPHYEIPTPAGTKSPEPPGAIINISGVAPVMDADGLIAADGTPITWDNYLTSDNAGNVIGSKAAQFTWMQPIEAAYEICFKCHSYYSYGTNPPAPNGSRRQTDPVKEFNPRNASTHAVMGASKANPAYGAYVGTDRWGNTWTATSKLYCDDCHGSDDPSAPRGPHGSMNKYILRKPYKPTTSSEGQNGTGADADSENHLCFMCHDPRNYLPQTISGQTPINKTGFSGGGTNFHADKHDGRACNTCHSMVAHGSKLPHLLVQTTDPYPYDNNAMNLFTPNGQAWTGTQEELINWINSRSGNWSENDCNAHSKAVSDGQSTNCS